MALFDQVAELLGDGHDLAVRSRSYGKTSHYWVVCACGYESRPGKSRRFAVNAGIGHVSRVAQKIAARATNSPAPVEESCSPPAPHVTDSDTPNIIEIQPAQGGRA